MTTIVTVHAAKTHLLRLIKQALRGEGVEIARCDKPVGRLASAEAPPPKRRFGSLKGKLKAPQSFFDALPEDELRLVQGS